jgi:DNA-binding transcriptional regulator YdaS (Cro superfamily)
MSSIDSRQAKWYAPAMKKTVAVQYYGSAYRLAAVLGINQSAVSRWRTYVPLLRALQLERDSGGVLRVDRDAYVRRAR